MGMGLGPVTRGPRTPQRGTPETPTPPGKSGPKGTPRAPGHLTGAGGTPAGPSFSGDHGGEIMLMRQLALQPPFPFQKDSLRIKLLRSSFRCKLSNRSSPPQRRSGTTESSTLSWVMILVSLQATVASTPAQAEIYSSSRSQQVRIGVRGMLQTQRSGRWEVRVGADA